MSQPGAGDQTPAPTFGLVDYFSCTLPVRTDADVYELQAALGGEWMMTPRGSYGYTKGLRCGGMTLWYAGRGDMGMHLQVTGAGCRELEVLTIKGGWPEFVGDLLEKGAKFSRVDVAIDDHSRLLSIKEIERCCLAGLVVGRFRAIEPKQQIDAVTGNRAKTGFIFGKRPSETLVRIYDKALQLGKEDHHIRVELETHGQKAKELAQRLAASGDGVIAGVIASALDFKVKGTDSHRYRWQTQDWWQRFLGEAKKLRLTTAPAMPSLEASIQALEHQYGPTLALIVKVYGHGRLDEIVASGDRRLTRKHFRLMSDHYKRGWRK